MRITKAATAELPVTCHCMNPCQICDCRANDHLISSNSHKQWHPCCHPHVCLALHLCRYLISLYYVIVTIGTVGYGDILPVNSTEVFISLIIIFIGLVFFGLLLGAIATSLQVYCTATALDIACILIHTRHFHVLTKLTSLGALQYRALKLSCCKPSRKSQQAERALRHL